MRRGLLAALLLAGCAGSGGWTKAGVDAAGAAREVADCRAAAADAVGVDAAIDQDILATRDTDRQRAIAVRAETGIMQEHTRDRAAALVGSCMRAKGFSEPGKP